MSKKSKEPTPPSVEATSAQSIQAQIDALPKILAAQQQYGPQFTQQFFNETAQFAPQILGLQRQLESQYTPELGAARGVLEDYFKQEQEMTPYEERQAKDTFRGAQSARGMAQSGMGAQEELRGLTQLRQQLKSQRLGLAMQMAGMGSPQTAALTSMSPVAQLGVQNVNPSQIFGLTQSNYANQMAQYNQNQQGKGQMFGSVLGLAGTLGGAFLGNPQLGSIMGKAAAGQVSGGSGGSASSMSGIGSPSSYGINSSNVSSQWW